ncbi:MAG TPA: BMP family ABC transporter substrate-binding protein, partial [Candidatus Limnocylindrales bacterium]
TATIGFVLVGARDDLGYNQAIWDGIDAVARSFPDNQILRVENVPEEHDALVGALEDLIDRGARILFATSFGYRDAAFEVARRHPDVVVLHQGGTEPPPGRGNFGTYFGAHYEPLYLAGIAAGAATETGRLGFVVAFPIAATFLNVDAFMLGARSVRPDATVTVEFTKDWCDPSIQLAAATRLRSGGVDVIAQHQDCTRTILEYTEANGMYAVGYHTDGSEVAPRAWLAGAVWRWGPLYVDEVTTVLRGKFTGSPFDGDYRTQFAGPDSVLDLASLNAALPADAAAAIREGEERFARGATPFDGPVTDREGRVRVPPGARLTESQVDTVDWFVEGVLGSP